MVARIAKELLNQLAEKIKNEVDLDIIEEGLDYFKKCCVKSVKIEDAVIRAEVSEPGERFFTSKAHIFVDDFSNNDCSCSSGEFCHHMAAAFFYLYSGYQWPSVFMAEVNKHHEEQMSKGLAKLHPKAAEGKTGSQNIPLPEGPLEAWYSYFEKEHRQLSRKLSLFSNRNDYDFYFFSMFRTIYTNFKDRIFSVCSQWPDKPRELFCFHGILFILNWVEDINLRLNNYYRDVFFDQCENDLVDHLPEPMTDEEIEKYRPFLQKALEITRSYYFKGSTAIFDWLYIYRLSWESYLCYQPWIKNEYHLLTEKFCDKAPEYYRAGLGLAHFFVLGKKDVEARKILGEINNFELSDIFYFLSGFSQTGQWGRLLEWLRWLMPWTTKADPNEFQAICHFWAEAADGAGVQDEYHAVLKSWLPSSYWFYSESLLEQREYKDWVDLTMCHCRDFLEISPEELRHVEAKAPFMILPLYHQWAVRLIEAKNRKSYQEAVRILKKLHRLYKKLKLGKEWDKFIKGLVDQYPRSRAFHEELQKGKLIS
ncbi:hypothetical protein P378_05245 [Desulforamulus profundi]|uniref:SWIM-type domain-containing protein n=1 Tax=Desulforamulus profundi TaxID=1383067 RepID=A0A2C6MHX6_9FIRM|nr:SWIM zinc finger family protein [Desulforamulus profundi]PHJ39113.1 hypothetical protein P378_05245 [Desulforamulus profundi]